MLENLSTSYSEGQRRIRQLMNVQTPMAEKVAKRLLARTVVLFVRPLGRAADSHRIFDHEYNAQKDPMALGGNDRDRRRICRMGLHVCGSVFGPRRFVELRTIQMRDVGSGAGE